MSPRRMMTSGLPATRRRSSPSPRGGWTPRPCAIWRRTRAPAPAAASCWSRRWGVVHGATPAPRRGGRDRSADHARHRDRALRGAGAGRPRRHGRGVRGLRSRARSQGRAQAAARRGRSARGATGRGRLLREAKAIARLSHPNVVVVHDVGTFDDRVFIAMEFVDGQTVGAVAGRAAARDRREILDVFLAAARGLSRRARRRPGPSRLQAAERDGRARRRGAGHGLRPGPPGRRRERRDPEGRRRRRRRRPHGDAARRARALGRDPDPDRRAAGHAAVHGARAVPRPPRPTRRPISSASASRSIGRSTARTRSAATGLAELMADVDCRQRCNRRRPRRSVPAWLRRVLLRGLSVDPAARWPSMAALIDRAGARSGARAAPRGCGRRSALAALLARRLRGLARGAPAESLCQAGASRLADVWEAAPPARATIGCTGVPGAPASPTPPRPGTASPPLLDGYAARWLAMYRDSCEATHVRGEQSTEVLDLRTACLDERLTRAARAGRRAGGRRSRHRRPRRRRGQRAADAGSLRRRQAAAQPGRAARERGGAPPGRGAAHARRHRRRAEPHRQAPARRWRWGAQLVGRGARARLSTAAGRAARSPVGLRQTAPPTRASRSTDLEEATWLALATRRDDVAAEARRAAERHRRLSPGPARRRRALGRAEPTRSSSDSDPDTTSCVRGC